MIGLETKHLDINFKDDGHGTGTFSAYPATWDGPDKANEIIQRGAFADSLGRFVKAGWVTVNHKRENPIATIDSAVEDSRGLLVHATFHSSKEAQAVRTIARERSARGKAVPFSIGYHVLASEPITMSGKRVRRLTRVDLKECSFVDMPCNDKAGLVEAKRATPALISVNDLKTWLESKEGRTISSDNLARLVAHRDELDDGVGLLTAFIEAHDPSAGEPNPFQSIDDSVAAAGGRTGGGAAVARAAKALQIWLDVQVKVGRALSADSHRELSGAHKALHHAVENLGGFLFEHRAGAVDEVGATMDKSGNPFLDGYQKPGGNRARLLAIKARSQELADRALLAVFEDEERTEAAASKVIPARRGRR